MSIPPPDAEPDPATEAPHARGGGGGIVHAYQKYDPQTFPSPTDPNPNSGMAAAAFEQMLMFGEGHELTDEELANAIRLDPSMFPQLGPSLQALRAMLEERKRRILEKYETDTVRQDAASAFTELSQQATPPKPLRDAFEKAIRDEQIQDLERLYYKNRDDRSPFARQLTLLIDALGNAYQIEELADTYPFTGREAMSIPEALEIKAELEQIDKLLEQLKNAEKDAQLAIIDMEALSEYAEPGQIESLNRLQEQIQEYLQQQAAEQGLEKSGAGYRLTPKALRLFQRHLLGEIFSDLAAARSGRHAVGVTGEGVVELERTKPYEFGDSAANIDIVQTIINGAVRGGADGRPFSVNASDITIHLTRNNPRCATAVLMDMSGSMRHNGQYIQCKRMALALDGLIRSEYPGDHLSFIEMYSIAKLRPIGEVPALLPKPVSIHASRVRLKADMSDPRIGESQLPQHFTNIQHALQLARQVLSTQDTPNRQVILITDGLPTAHFEGQELFFLYPPDPLTERATMREALLCQRAGITINIFLLPSWSQSSEDIQFAQRLAETTKGRVFFTGGRDLDRYVVWDYVNQRRRVIG